MEAFCLRLKIGFFVSFAKKMENSKGLNLKPIDFELVKELRDRGLHNEAQSMILYSIKTLKGG